MTGRKELPDALQLSKRRGILPPVSYDPSRKHSTVTGLGAISERRGTIFSSFADLQENDDDTGPHGAPGEPTTEDLYAELTDDDEKERARKVLRGKYREDELPTPVPNTVLLYVSNASKDFNEEISVLQKRAYPQIRAYCQQKYGLDFHAIDLDRESRDSNTDNDHIYFAIVSEQISHSQKLSMGPCFLAFLGEKYGTVDPPKSFVSQDFRTIKKTLSELSVNSSLLDKWYEQDTNDEAGQYFLLPQQQVLGSDCVPSAWRIEREELMHLLIKALNRGVRVGSISKAVLQSTTASVMEKQIEEGVFHVLRPADRSNNCICFMRHINDMDANVGDAMADIFTDLTIKDNGSCARDEEKKKAMQTLKQKIKASLPSANVMEESLRWIKPMGVDPAFHKIYFDRLVRNVVDKVQQLVDANVAKQQLHNLQPRDPFYLEVLQQWHFAQIPSKQLQGRTELHQTITQYCTTTLTNEPLVLHGGEGSGRSAVMSRAAQTIASSGQGIVLLRFCGSTPASTHFTSLLHNLCVHAAHVTSMPLNTVPQAHSQIREFFSHILSSGVSKGSSLGPNETFKGRIVVFLDSIELLEGSNVDSLDWLPVHLASNIKVVVSTLTGHAQHMSASFRFSEEQVEQVADIEINNCNVALRDNLRWRNRKLTDEQYKGVKELLSKNRSLLYTMMLVEESLLWSSSTSLPDISSFPKTVYDFMWLLLDRVEQQCNPILVAHCLGMLSLSQHGLSSLEIKGMLSLDDRVMSEVFHNESSSIRSVPYLNIARVFHSLRHLLVNRQVDGTTMFFWRHQITKKVIRDKYIQEDDEFERNLHKIMADYFRGVFSNENMKGHKHALRNVPKQPLTFKDSRNPDAKEFYNLRKLSQLPFHLAHAQMNAVLQQEVYFNFVWLKTKLQALSLQHIIQDCHLVDDFEVQILLGALLLAEESVTHDPDKFGLELSCRLISFADQYQVIQDLILECDNDAHNSMPVIPLGQAYLGSGGPLQEIFHPRSTAEGRMDFVFCEIQGRALLAMKPRHMASLRVVDTVSQESLPDIQCMPGANMHASQDGRYICMVTDDVVTTYCVLTGRQQSQFRMGSGMITEFTVSNTHAAFILKDTKGPIMLNIVNGSIVRKLEYQANLVISSSNDQFLLTNMGKVLILLDLISSEKRCVHQVNDLPQKVLFSTTKPCFFMKHFDPEATGLLKVTKVKPLLAKREATASGLIEDNTLVDFCLSHQEDRLLFVTESRLYVLNVDTEEVQGIIAHMPQGFQETLTKFRAAAFANADRLIVGLRYLHIAFWDSNSLRPLKVYQTSVSSPKTLMTVPTVNRLVVPLSDESVQVWHPSEELLAPEVVQYPVSASGALVAVATAQMGNRLIYFGQGRPGKGVIFDIAKGREDSVLDIQESLPEGAQIQEVSFSPQGKYILTKYTDTSIESSRKAVAKHKSPMRSTWEVLVHQTVTSSKVTQASECFFSAISNQDDLFINVCLQTHPPAGNSGPVYVINVKFLNEKEPDLKESYLPEGELDGPPVLTENGEYLLMVFDLATQQDRVFHQRFPQPGRALLLCTTSELRRSVSNKGRALQQMDYTSWRYITDEDYLLAVYPLKADFILLLFAEGVGKPELKEDKEAFKKQPKVAVVYSVKSKRITKCFHDFMRHDSDIERFVFSSQGTFILDQQGHIFSSADNKLLNKIPLLGIDPRTICFLFDGKYVLTLTMDHRRLLIFLSDKSEIVASVHVHGIAKCVHIAKDGQILVLPCEDGRIMRFRTLLDYSPAMGLASSLVPTHKFRPAIHPLPEIPDDRDENIESVSTVSNNDLERNMTAGDTKQIESKKTNRWAKLRVEHAAGAFSTRRPSLNTLAKAVVVTHRHPKNKSRACVIQ